MTGPAVLPLSVAIPTFGRDEVLTDTIGQLLQQSPPAAELVIVDQTPMHDAETQAQLQAWHEQGRIRWIRRQQPSQPGALNVAMQSATQPFLLMLDDDIRIEPGFLAAHCAGFADPSIWAVIGQVLQPEEQPLEGYARPASSSPMADLAFPFRSDAGAFIENGMSGNMTVRLDRALALGGFDENFEPPVSYRFDTEFCKRLVRAGGRIRFVPEARIHHLRAARGGTRSVGSHLTSMSPLHGAGDYYFALLQGWHTDVVRYILRRPWREVRTRFHLRHPWWIPVKLLGELRAFVSARQLVRKGPRLIPTLADATQSAASSSAVSNNEQVQ